MPSQRRGRANALSYQTQSIQRRQPESTSEVRSAARGLIVQGLSAVLIVSSHAPVTRTFTPDHSWPFVDGCFRPKTVGQCYFVHAQLLEVIGPPRSEANTLGFDRRQNLPDRTFCRAAKRGSLLPPRAAHEVHRVMSNVKQPDCTIKTPPDHPKHKEEVLDEAIEETFPASDPVSVTIDRSPEERGQPSKLDRLDEARKREEEEKR
jgi:hypothetical protein